MKKRKECETCFYSMAAAVLGEHRENFGCGWDNKAFHGETKTKCRHYERGAQKPPTT